MSRTHTSSRGTKGGTRRAPGPFRATRGHHSSEAAEDYTELVAELIETEGEARIGRIAERLGISHVTALRTVRRLVRDGYLDTSARQPIALTAKGKRVAEAARERHDLLLDFLKLLGVPARAAEIDAEGMEHHVGPATMKAIRKFVERARARSFGDG